MDGNDNESGQHFDEETQDSGESDENGYWSEEDEDDDQKDNSKSDPNIICNHISNSCSVSEFNKLESNYCSDVNEKPTTAPTLEKMASIRVAIALWINTTITIPEIKVIDRYFRSTLNGKICKRIDVLPVPKTLITDIKKHFKRVRFNGESWISYNYQAVFFTRRQESDLYQLIDRIIWHPNEKIDFAETARNLLNSNYVTNEEKFHLACKYCLREDVQRMWPTMRNHEVNRIHFFRNPLLIDYWKYYCTSNFNEVEVRSHPLFGEYTSIIKQPPVDNWPAIEYFFDRLKSEQQVDIAIWLIEKYKMRFQNLLLLKLNESQRLSVIMNDFGSIFRNFLSYRRIDDNKENFFKTWYDVCELITQEQFVAVFDLLFSNTAEDVLLAEIWTIARDDLKHYVLNQVEFFEKVVKWLARSSEESLTFVSSVLSDLFRVDIEREIMKKQVFSVCCIQISCRNVDVLNHVMNIYFPEPTESTEFKISLVKNPYFGECCKTLMNRLEIQKLIKLLDFGVSNTHLSSMQFVKKVIGEHLKLLNYQCLTYYSTGNIKGLNNFLSPLGSSYPEIISEFKSKLLMSQRGVEACINHLDSRKNILVKIIADGVPIKLASRFKKKIIFSYEGMDKLKDMIIEGRLKSNSEKFFGWFLKSDRDRKNWKKRFTNHLKQSRRYTCSQDEDKFSEFLSQSFLN